MPNEACAPISSPRLPAPSEELGRHQLAPFPVDEFQPHPTAGRQELTVPASQLFDQVEQSDLKFRAQTAIVRGSANVRGPLEGRPVVRSPQSLKLHRALDELGWFGAMSELNEAVQRSTSSTTEPILSSTKGTILAGFGRWQAAILSGEGEINCIEYSLDEEEALQFIIRHHQPERGWNAFLRICLALKLEACFEKIALDNLRAGGKYKGLADLPRAQSIDVREEIARVAGVGARNVTNVKTILQTAHGRMKEALRNGTLTINRAMQFCKLPRDEQLEEFVRYEEERATNKVIRQTIPRPKTEAISPAVRTVLDALQQQEERQPGSVAVRVGRHKRTVVLVGQDLLAGTCVLEKLNLT